MADPVPTPADTQADASTSVPAAAAATQDQTQQTGRPRESKGGGRRGGRGVQGPQTREVRVSMALSKLLRHKATSAGISLDAEGFAKLDKVLAWPPLKSEKATVEDIKACTRDNAKQRFTMKPNPATNPSADSTDSADASHWLIRANQGHSIAIESSALLSELTLSPDAQPPLPPVVLHGTYFAFWPQILASGGLKRMTRNHVHCSTGIPGTDAGVISGMRRDAEIIIEVDVEAALRDGTMKWWLSSNGVVLTEGDENGFVPLRYFRKVEGVKGGVGVLMENGEKLADLPPGLEIRAPKGKNHGRGGRR